MFIDYVGMCEVRIAEKLQGHEWLISNCKKKLCCPFCVPMMNLVDRPEGGLSEFDLVVKCGENLDVCEVRMTEEFQGLEWLISNINNKLCCPFCEPVMNLMFRLAGGC